MHRNMAGTDDSQLTYRKVLVQARQPGFGFDRSDVARRQLEPQLQNFLSRHPVHMSIAGITDEIGRGTTQGIGTTVVLPYQQTRRECTESPPCLAMNEPTVGMLWIIDVEFLKDFEQPLDRRIVLASAGPSSNCIIGHRQSTQLLEAATPITAYPGAAFLPPRTPRRSKSALA